MTVTDEEPSVIYGLDYQTRALSNLQGEPDRVQFLIGTQNLKSENQLCFIDLEEDTNQVSKKSYPHTQGEIWHVSSCPSDKRILSTCYSRVEGNRCVHGCSVWALESHSNGNHHGDGNLTLVSELDGKSNSVTCFEWQPIGSGCTKAFVLHDRHISVIDSEMNGKTFTIISDIELDTKSPSNLVSGKWNPHHNSNTIATSSDSTVRGWDIRSKQQTFTIENAHVQVVRNLDFNPNRQYIMATCGDDCKVKFWDTRRTDKALSIISQHSHWVWSARFNPVHDQLLLSSSSDSRVVLHCAASLSSELTEPLVEDDAELSDETEFEQLEDGVVRIYEEHEESVYGCEWAASDPWIFASLSYDGRLLINRVPRSVKYKILQL